MAETKKNKVSQSVSMSSQTYHVAKLLEEGRLARKRVRHLNVEGPLGALGRAPLADRGTRTLLNLQ